MKKKNGWGESGVEQRDESSGRTENRRGGVKSGEKRLIQGWITGYGRCCAVLSWSTLGEMLWASAFNLTLVLAWKKHLSALITLMGDGWKHFVTCHFTNVSGCAEFFVLENQDKGQSYLMCQSFWIVIVAWSNSPQMKLESRRNLAKDIRFLMRLFHHCIFFLSLFKLLTNILCYFNWLGYWDNFCVVEIEGIMDLSWI